MNCRETVERVPWLLNGTLGDEEARRIRDHLASCDACREELRQTRLAGALFAGHLPAESLVDYALGLPMADARRRLVESHLATCPTCREELELLRPEPEATRSPEPRPRSPAWLRYAALAASLIAVLSVLLAAGGWLRATRRLAGERAAWTRQEEDLRARLAALTAPRLNPPVLDLLPSAPDPDLRAAPLPEDPFVNRVRLPPDAAEVVLTLLAGDLRCDPACAVELLDPAGHPVWSAQGLHPTPAGHVTLILPTDLLPAPPWTLRLSDPTAGERVLRYVVEGW